MKPNRRKDYVSWTGLKAFIPLNRREVEIVKRETALVERDADLAKRESLVAAMVEIVKESSASASEMLEQMKSNLAARASLLDVTKSALDDVVVLEIEAFVVRHKLVALLSKDMRKLLGQVFDEAQADGEWKGTRYG